MTRSRRTTRARGTCTENITLRRCRRPAQPARSSRLPQPLAARRFHVEHRTLIGSGAPFDTLDVSRHEKLVTTDKHWTAQARAGAETEVIMVDRSDVTQIRPYAPYTALRYGIVLQVKKVTGGDTLYWVAWDDGRVDEGALEERIKMTSRVVPSRPSWVDEPDWSKWPEEVQERVRSAKATYSVDDE